MNPYKVILQRYLLNTKYQSTAGVACARKILGNYGQAPCTTERPQSASKYSHRRDYFTRRENSISFKGLRHLKKGIPFFLQSRQKSHVFLRS